MSALRREAVSLRPEAERAWDRVRTGFALHDRFWLGLLFGVQQHEAAEFIARSRDLSGNGAHLVEEIELGGTETVGAVLGELLGVPSPGLFATWLNDGGGPDRTTVWTALLERLNERRDVLRTTRPAAVLLICPPGTMELIRDAAPDLWSVRSVTATVERPASVLPCPSTDAPRVVELRFTPVEGEQVLASVAVGPILRRAATALRAGRIDGAILAAQEALAAAAGPDDQALAHSWLARARHAQKEPLEAQRHARLARAGGGDLGRDSTVALLEILSTSDDEEVALDASSSLVALRRSELAGLPESVDALGALGSALRSAAGMAHADGRHEDALASYTEALDLARRVHTEAGDTATTLRDTITVLTGLGDVQRARNHLDDALVSYTEALDLARRAVGVAGETASTLFHLSFALRNLAKIEYDRGQHDDALSSYAEALELARRFASITDDPDLTVRYPALVLGEIGGVHDAQGRVDDALGCYTESLGLFRHLRSTTGDSVETMNRLARALDRIGAIHESRWQIDDALAAGVESLDLRRRVRAMTGDTIDTLRSLAMALERVAGLHLLRVGLEEALRMLGESVELRRRMQDLTGDVVESLRDLGESLRRLGTVQDLTGQVDAGLDTHTESVELARRVRYITGDDPDTLDALSDSLHQLGKHQRTHGDLTDAVDRLQESLALRRGIRAAVGDTPDILRDLAASLHSVGDVQCASGRLIAAADAFAEALDVGRLIRQNYGDTFVVLFNLRGSAIALARIEEARGARYRALALYREAQGLDSQLPSDPQQPQDSTVDLGAAIDRLTEEPLA